jgi:hypothetical protein
MKETGVPSGTRKDTYRWIAAGLLSGIIINVVAWLYWPRFDPIDQPVDRLLLALQCCAGVGFVALIMLQGLWRLPDSPGAEDPFANAESRGWKINQRVFSNTVEQAMLPALMTIWCAGRFMFWAGYRHSLNARAIGMDWTTITTMVAATWFVATFF